MLRLRGLAYDGEATTSSSRYISLAINNMIRTGLRVYVKVLHFVVCIVNAVQHGVNGN